MWEKEFSVEDKVIINIEERKFQCSRNKLSEHSSYFSAMFGGSFKEKDESCVNIKDANANGFSTILKYLNCEIESFDKDDLFDVLDCAFLMQFDEIKIRCIEQSLNDLRTETCLQLWAVSEKHDIHPLCEMAKCKAFMEFNSLKKSKYILNLSPRQLHSYLSSTLLHCDNEIDVFETGMKWWYEYSSKLENISPETSRYYLLLILGCIDFKNATHGVVQHILAYPEFDKDSILSHILLWISRLICGLYKENDLQNTKELPYLVKQVNQLYFNSKPRNRSKMPCVITSELSWQPGQKNCGTERVMNISYYDKSCRYMKNLLETNDIFKIHCPYSLKGCKVLPYKENLLVFGGEDKYGTANWNTNIWLYHTFLNKWELITKMPKERRHFQACIIDEKLFIIGGTGKYRIQLHDDMFYFDFNNYMWTLNVQLPYELYEMHFCNYKNQLLFMRIGSQSKFYGYLYNIELKTWTTISSSTSLEKIPTRYITFSENDIIYVRGVGLNHGYLIQYEISGTNLIEQKFCYVTELCGDVINYFVNEGKLYVFNKYTMDEIYVLECFDLDSKTNLKLIQINDSSDVRWHISKGCFGMFIYSMTENHTCITNYLMEDEEAEENSELVETN